MKKKELTIHLLVIFITLLGGWWLGCRREPTTWLNAILVVFIYAILFRTIDYNSRFLKIERIWLYFVNIAFTPSLYRILLLFCGSLLQNKRQVWRLGPFDFYDYAVGIGLVGLFLWSGRYCMKYFSYFDCVTAGMTFKEKILWDLQKTKKMICNMFLPSSKWIYDDIPEPIKSRISLRMVSIMFLLAAAFIIISLPYLPETVTDRAELVARRFFPGYEPTNLDENLQTTAADEGTTADEEMAAADEETTTADEEMTTADEEKQTEKELAEQAEMENELQRYPLLSAIPSWEQENNYISLVGEESSPYVIKPGDTLWGLAKRFYNTGTSWTLLKKKNPGLQGDGTLLIPGKELHIPNHLYYIKKQQYSLGGLQDIGAYSYDYPVGWIYGSLQLDACLSSMWSTVQKDVDVSVHTTQNTIFPDGINDEQWEDMKQQISAAAGKDTTLSFSTINFNKFTKINGTDILTYSFIADNGTQKIQFAVAYVPGEKYLTEILGRCPLPENTKESVFAIEELVNYMAASYEEYGGEKNIQQLKMRPYLGAANWPWEKLHNPFAMAENEYALQADIPLAIEDKNVEFTSKSWEKLLYALTVYYNDLSPEEEDELINRPLRLSDLAWITEVTLEESVIPGRNVIMIGSQSQKLYLDENKLSFLKLPTLLTTLEDIAILPNLRILKLDIGGVTDFEVLGKCTSLTELSVYAQEFPTGTGWLKDLPQLKSLSLGASTTAAILSFGYVKEGGSSFDGKDNNQGYAPQRELEENLGQCSNLEYLQLYYSGTLNYNFLEKLPNLYAFLQYPEEEMGKEEADWNTWVNKFDENSFPQIKCLVLGDEWLRNPE